MVVFWEKAMVKARVLLQRAAAWLTHLPNNLKPLPLWEKIVIPLLIALIAGLIVTVAGGLMVVHLITPPATVTPKPACTDNSRFVDDVTIPDQTVVKPGTKFVKEWRILNPKADGTCPWTNDYTVFWVGDENLAASSSFDLPETVQISLHPLVGRENRSIKVWELESLPQIKPHLGKMVIRNRSLVSLRMK